MRRWETLAAPDDPNVWSDVSGMWPTKRGTYITAQQYSTSDKTATGEVTAGTYAFCAATLSGTRSYVCGDATWEVATALTLTNRTGGVGIPQFMCQFGDVTIGACGTVTATVFSTGGNFANLAGAPKANIVVTQAGAVLAFNTDTSADGWAASDVFDYTNWTTGEAASGRLLQTPGPILGAIAFQDYVLVFKPSSIYRMRYVGGTVKWTSEVVWRGMGMFYNGNNASSYIQALAVCGDRVAFVGPSVGNTTTIYSFDGVTVKNLAPNHSTMQGTAFVYDPAENRLYCHNGASPPNVYCFETGQWGTGTAGSTYPTVVVTGDTSAINKHYGQVFTAPYGWTGSGNIFTLYSPSASSTVGPLTCSVRTSKMGDPAKKSTFSRLTPLLREGGGQTQYGFSHSSSSAAVTAETFRERHDVVAVTSASIAESSTRKRFDMLGSPLTDNYGRFTVTYTDYTVEIEDVVLESSAAGTD